MSEGKKIELYNEDNMQLMARYPDKYFDLAIVDPPYGIDMDGGKIGIDGAGKAKQYTKYDWDKKAPDKAYFDELMRVSKNQIIWGANHFIEKINKKLRRWFQMIKLIASDMDGTLLNEKHNIDKETVEAIKKAEEAGVGHKIEVYSGNANGTKAVRLDTAALSQGYYYITVKTSRSVSRKAFSIVK